ncbi:MAG: NAD(P)-dependent oxidoreductase [Bacteroidetes bacterium]|nr:NAD(P)-dependent oxidoreductase [Bacteroidota bacterium]
MKKLLITGASGFLGHHLLRLCASQYDVYGLFQHHKLEEKDVTALRCDISNYVEIGNVMEDVEPDAVIHAAAISDANFCQQHRQDSYLINVEASKNIAGLCCDWQIPFVFTSTDLVFDGKQGMYAEMDERNPLNVYGEQKCEAEDGILSIYPGARIARLPLMFGLPLSGSGNYLQNFVTTLQSHKAVKLFDDEFRSVCGAKSIAEGLLLYLFYNDAPNILHLAGSQKLSRYEFGTMAAEAFGLNGLLIEKCSQKDVPMPAPRPADVSLDISKARLMGYHPMGVAEELNLIASRNYI